MILFDSFKEAADSLNYSIKIIGKQVGSIISRNDFTPTVQNNQIFENKKDKVIISDAIDTLVLNEEEEIKVILSNGEEVVITM